MIIVGALLLIAGVVTGIGIFWTLGIIVLVIGLILWLAGSVGHPVYGRRWYW
jgi:membrane-bound ClpP family serine protease